MSKSAIKKVATGAIIAGAVGYVVGILTAPKSGKETRQDIKNEVGKRLNEAERQLKIVLADLTKLISDAKAVSDKLSGSAQQELVELIAKAKDSKEKARTVLSAVHEGDAEDKDLQFAIKEANSAISHLKKYLKK